MACRRKDINMPGRPRKSAYNLYYPHHLTGMKNSSPGHAFLSLLLLLQPESLFAYDDIHDRYERDADGCSFSPARSGLTADSFERIRREDDPGKSYLVERGGLPLGPFPGPFSFSRKKIFQVEAAGCS
jgi:hypothetical protein